MLAQAAGARRQNITFVIFDFFRNGLTQTWLNVSEAQSNDFWQVVGGIQMDLSPLPTLIFVLVENRSIPVVNSVDSTLISAPVVNWLIKKPNSKCVLV